MSVNVKQTLVFLSPLPWQCPHVPASGISCPSDRQPAHFVSQSWTQGVFFLLGHSSYLGAVFFTSGVQLLLQVYEGGEGRHEKSFGSLCWFSCPCARTWWWHAVERLKPQGPSQPPAPKATGCSCLLPGKPRLKSP